MKSTLRLGTQSKANKIYLKMRAFDFCAQLRQFKQSEPIEITRLGNLGCLSGYF
jgi:hypothetical protein